MFGLFKKKNTQVAEPKSYEEIRADRLKFQSDNLKLIARVGVLEKNIKDLKEDNQVLEDQKGSLENEIDAKDNEIDNLKDKIAALEERLADAKQDKNEKKVTYASARKVMTKAKLKDMRKALEAVPAGANGFSGSVTVYDKKKKTLKNVKLESKQQALDIVTQAEKGNVDIVL
ncbi:MAG: hypothetical protein OIN85_01075 [Candidatus Methanoperedens sp.]|nr:hypothetical protein [Candidatus Methanoperedens sp.]